LLVFDAECTAVVSRSRSRSRHHGAAIFVLGGPKASGEHVDGKASPPATKKPAAAEGLRKRGGGGADAASKSGGDGGGDSDAETVSPATTPNTGAKDDPIRWFGMMTPRPFKISQKKFKEVVQRSVTVAGLRCRMAAVRHEYAALIKKKGALTGR
jgi:hypothetical protein